MRWTLAKTQLRLYSLFIFPIAAALYLLYRQIGQSVNFTYLEFIATNLVTFHYFNLAGYGFVMVYFTGVGIGAVKKPDLAELNKAHIPYTGTVFYNLFFLLIPVFFLFEEMKGVDTGIQILIVFTHICMILIGSLAGIYRGKRVFRKILSLKGPTFLWDEEMMRELRR